MRAARAWLAAFAAIAFAGAARAAVPAADAVQSAYEAARVENAERHVFDLLIQHAACNEIKGGDSYACQIDFVRRAEPDKRLYFDVVTIAERDGRWTLLSGLCVKPSR